MLLLILFLFVNASRVSSSYLNLNRLLEQAMEVEVDTKFVCQTIIFSGEYNQELLRSDTFSHMATVISTSNQAFQLPVVSFFDRDRLRSELISPSSVGQIRYSAQCSVVLLNGRSLSQINSLLETLSSKRLAITTRDIFVFYGPSKIMISLTQSPVFSYLTYRHVVYPTESRTKGEVVAMNFCDLTPISTSLRLFNRNCKGIINGRTVRAAVLIGAAHYRYYRDSDGNLRPSGTYRMLFEECSKRLNYTMHAYMVSTSGRKINGTWTGALGEISKRNADITFPIAGATSRSLVMDGTRPVHALDKVFWVKIPSASTSPQAVLRPFAVPTWLCLLLSMIITTTVLYASIRYDNLTEPHGTTRNIAATLSSAILRPLLEQSRPLNSRYDVGTRTRCILFLWAIFSLTMGTAYRSKLFLFLSFQQPEDFPQTYNQLAYDFSNYRILYRSYGGVADSYLLRSNKPMHQVLLARNRLEIVNATEVCITGMIKGDKVACIDFDFAGEHAIVANGTLYAQADSKGTKLVKRSLDNDGKYLILWGFRKGSPIKDIIDSVMAWTQDTGLFEHWVNVDWTNQKYDGMRYLKSQMDSTVTQELARDESEAADKVRKINMKVIRMPILLEALGIILSFGIFVWESQETMTASNTIVMLWRMVRSRKVL